MLARLPRVNTSTRFFCLRSNGISQVCIFYCQNILACCCVFGGIELNQLRLICPKQSVHGFAHAATINFEEFVSNIRRCVYQEVVQIGIMQESMRLKNTDVRLWFSEQSHLFVKEITDPRDGNETKLPDVCLHFLPCNRIGRRFSACPLLFVIFVSVPVKLNQLLNRLLVFIVDRTLDDSVDQLRTENNSSQKVSQSHSSSLSVMELYAESFGRLL
mmetsp:Transcript_10062/g.23614  ORF Transcript_10062/g.23614 Transcript_10062/m.23614 type:complete len:216 (-) Transcript_10062:132-779(-)